MIFFKKNKEKQAIKIVFKNNKAIIKKYKSNIKILNKCIKKINKAGFIAGEICVENYVITFETKLRIRIKNSADVPENSYTPKAINELIFINSYCEQIRNYLMKFFVLDKEIHKTFH